MCVQLPLSLHHDPRLGVGVACRVSAVAALLLELLKGVFRYSFHKLVN